MYPEELTKPMVEELTSVGFIELKDSKSVVSELLEDSGKCLVLINSVCGCAAGAARPGVKNSLKLISDEDLSSKITWVKDDEKINFGTDIRRMTFHYWNHLGEIASVRQLLGKDPGNPGYGSWSWRY